MPWTRCNGKHIRTFINDISAEGMTWDAFFDVIINGRGVEQGAQKGNVMPAFGENSNVAPHIEDMFRYVKARADGKIRRGVRLPKLPKFKEE